MAVSRTAGSSGREPNVVIASATLLRVQCLAQALSGHICTFSSDVKTFLVDARLETSCRRAKLMPNLIIWPLSIPRLAIPTNMETNMLILRDTFKETYSSYVDCCNLIPSRHDGDNSSITTVQRLLSAFQLRSFFTVAGGFLEKLVRRRNG